LVGLRILIKKKVFAQKKINFCLPAFINIYLASIQKALTGNKTRQRLLFNQNNS
jgi:hypothetical protein